MRLITIWFLTIFVFLFIQSHWVQNILILNPLQIIQKEYKQQKIEHFRSQIFLYRFDILLKNGNFGINILNPSSNLSLKIVEFCQQFSKIFSHASNYLHELLPCYVLVSIQLLLRVWSLFIVLDFFLWVVGWLGFLWGFSLRFKLFLRNVVFC